MKDISVIILCYRAESKVYGFVEKTAGLLEASGLFWEIILVGNYIDGSDDKTPEIVKNIAAKKKNVKALTLPKKGMMGWDARSGMNLAEGNFICLIDGDEQMPYQDIIRVYDKIKNEGFDFVQTYRIVRHDGVIRKSISAVYNFVFKLLFYGTGMRDVNSKPKILTKEAYNKMSLKSDDWFIDAEMVIQSRRLKLHTGEIPTTFYKCGYRKSYVNFYAVFEFIRNLCMARTRELFKK
jgi:glycosyltransferase involved in cell wall biosynthesis